MKERRSKQIRWYSSMILKTEYSLSYLLEGVFFLKNGFMMFTVFTTKTEK